MAVRARRSLLALTMVLAVVFTLTVIISVKVIAAERRGGLKIAGVTGTGEPNGRRCLVVFVHGWIEKGQGQWPQDYAEALAARTDAQKWACGYFDWSGGAMTFNPREAAVYARDKAGPELAEEILAIRTDWQHIHLIGHSCGAIVISEAAKRIAAATKADLHLTFLDAYVPRGWDPNSLGDMTGSAGTNWAEQYFTRDSTGKETEVILPHAFNVDITAVDTYLKDHNFPKYWYYATITGKYPHWWLVKASTNFASRGLEYGIKRALEGNPSDPNGWARSLRMPMGNKVPVLIMP
jgi:pimeloyl-ACP methyl ester carboxylesterase